MKILRLLFCVLALSILSGVFLHAQALKKVGKDETETKPEPESKEDGGEMAEVPEALRKELNRDVILSYLKDKMNAAGLNMAADSSFQEEGVQCTLHLWDSANKVGILLPLPKKQEKDMNMWGIAVPDGIPDVTEEEQAKIQELALKNKTFILSLNMDDFEGHDSMEGGKEDLRNATLRRLLRAKRLARETEAFLDALLDAGVIKSKTAVNTEKEGEEK